MMTSQILVSLIRLQDAISSLAQTDVVISAMNSSLPAKALIDSGAAGHFIWQTLLDELGIKRIRSDRTMLIQNILGKLLGQGQIGFHSPLVTMRISPNHV